MPPLKHLPLSIVQAHGHLRIVNCRKEIQVESRQAEWRKATLSVWLICIVYNSSASGIFEAFHCH